MTRKNRKNTIWGGLLGNNQPKQQAKQTKPKVGKPKGTNKSSVVSHKSKPVYDPCTHDGVVKITDLGQSEIYAGAFRDVKEQYADFDLFIALNDKPVTNPIKLVDCPPELLKDYPTLKDFQTDKPQVIVDWPDFGSPPLSVGLLRGLIRQIQAGPKRRVVVYCDGGHGRTGTFLTILLDYIGVANPLNKLRTKYCRKAVESNSQVAFLTDSGIQLQGAKAIVGSYTTLTNTYAMSAGYQEKDILDPAKDYGIGYAGKCQKPYKCEFGAEDKCVHCGSSLEDLIDDPTWAN